MALVDRTAYPGSVLEATTMDITAAFQAKQAGRRREVDVTRAALRLTDEALAELRGTSPRSLPGPPSPGPR
jgi:hypothetical protein